MKNVKDETSGGQTCTYELFLKIHTVQDASIPLAFIKDEDWDTLENVKEVDREAVKKPLTSPFSVSSKVTTDSTTANSGTETVTFSQVPLLL